MSLSTVLKRGEELWWMNMELDSSLRSGYVSLSACHALAGNTLAILPTTCPLPEKAEVNSETTDFDPSPAFIKQWVGAKALPDAIQARASFQHALRMAISIIQAQKELRACTT